MDKITILSVIDADLERGFIPPKDLLKQLEKISASLSKDIVIAIKQGGFWAKYLPRNKNEALFIAQLLCDGGINKYGLSCAGLTENLLKDIELNFGLASASEVDEYVANLDKEGEVE